MNKCSTFASRRITSHHVAPAVPLECVGKPKPDDSLPAGEAGGAAFKPLADVDAPPTPPPPASAPPPPGVLAAALTDDDDEDAEGDAANEGVEDFFDSKVCCERVFK